MIDALIAVWELEYKRAAEDFADSCVEFTHEHYGYNADDFGPEDWAPEVYDRYRHAENVFNTLQNLRGMPESYWICF